MAGDSPGSGRDLGLHSAARRASCCHLSWAAAGDKVTDASTLSAATQHGQRQEVNTLWVEASHPPSLPAGWGDGDGGPWHLP